MKKIQILLSTYNGEKYLRKQLDSFLSLENKEDVSVFIRDDGSTDGTRAILAEYEEKHGFRVLLGENVGLNASLQILFEHADDSCLFYAYCDQDDVWLPDKLCRAIAFLEKESTDSPVLYAARSHLTDAEGNIIGITRTPKRPPSFYNAMVQNVCIGHTQVYNRPMLALLRRSYHKDIFVMDHWAYLLASAFGKILFDPSPVTLYRQHGKNSIGYGKGFFSIMRNRFRRTHAGVPRHHGKQLEAFVALYAEALPEQKQKEARLFLTKRRNIFTRLGYLFGVKAHRQGFTENFAFRLLYLFGGYNSKKQKNK